MTPSSLVVGYDFLWFSFAGCLFALVAYDLFHLLVRLILQFLEVRGESHD